VIAQLTRGLSRDKYELHLGLITQKDTSAEQLPASVSIHALGAPRVRAAAFPLLRLVRRLKPQVVLSGMAHLNFLVLLLRPFFPQATQVLVRQNETVSATLAFGDQPCYTRLLYRLLYRHADGVICQSSAMMRDLAAELGMPDKRLTVLPNPVNVDEIRDAVEDAPSLWAGSGPHLVAIGRLSREKGFDLLLRALVTIRERLPQADLLIAGAGPEEAPLKAERSRLGLDAAVRFAGYVDRPSAYFPGASLFVLPSWHEGLPNALLEAAAAGLPIVALPASEGVADLLRGQPGAWLASESTSGALAASLLAALDALRPGERFAHPFMQQFSYARAIRAYEELIDATLSERPQ